ncbi:hypothetical protein JQ615_10585 [Bradyrhizobium jicamae]|uniref:Uncharacterized protein n=1 Tax=Bradyrhizobium jicamae TaxID=280332 RepID=A0ABS5FGG5_9BRAD|nr:hypothetical protein [Bradyrhizobium jicamae]MBR0795837.1 hypothetical protein [Bradyrhizobium jicamae]MBR0933860.1 hypothetical protein [Bradyrhizobium jicamae]
MNIKLALIGLAALGGAAVMSGAAAAMPNGLPLAGHVTGDTSDIAQVRYVCDPFGNCRWRPGAYGAYGYYGPRHHGWHHRPHYQQRHYYQGPHHHGGHHGGGHHGGHHR